MRADMSVSKSALIRQMEWKYPLPYILGKRLLCVQQRTVWHCLLLHFNTYVHVLVAVLVPQWVCMQAFIRYELSVMDMFVCSYSFYCSVSVKPTPFYHSEKSISIHFAVALCILVLLFSNLNFLYWDETELHMFFLPGRPCHPLFPPLALLFSLFSFTPPFSLSGPMWKMWHHQNHRNCSPSLLK